MKKIAQRKHGQGSAFSEWLRDETNHTLRPREDNIRINDIDWFIWKKSGSYGDGYYMMIEEKCYDKLMTPDQALMYKKLENIHSVDPWYLGFHFLRFGGTTPDDGSIHLDEKYISKDDLIQFMKFGSPKEWYKSYFEKLHDRKIPWMQLTVKRDASYYS